MNHVTKEAFIKARKKFSYSAFEELIDVSMRLYEQHMSPKTWKGFRIIAVDGTTLRLPKEAEIVEHFGINKKDSSRPLARASQAFDVLNKVTLHATVAPEKVGERTLFIEHLFNLPSQPTLLLMDRGYPATWLFQLIVALGRQFCVRAPISWSTQIEQFVASGKREEVVELSMTKDSIQKLASFGFENQSQKIRLIRVELEGGEIEVLATSLIDPENVPAEIFKELYFKRWGIEEDYKLLKCRAELENFSGKSVESIYQDFFARVLFKNIVSILVQPVNEVLGDKKKTGRKYSYQISFNQTLGCAKSFLVNLFLKPVPLHWLQSFWETICCSAQPIRPNRSTPRDPNKKRKSITRNYISTV